METCRAWARQLGTSAAVWMMTGFGVAVAGLLAAAWIASRFVSGPQRAVGGPRDQGAARLRRGAGNRRRGCSRSLGGLIPVQYAHSDEIDLTSLSTRGLATPTRGR